MTELIAKLLAAYLANGTLMALTPGGIANTIGRNLPLDYVILQAKPGDVTPTYGDKPLGEVVVTFALWCNKGGAQAAIIANAIIDYFKDYMPTLIRGSVTNVNLAQPPIVIPQMRKDSNGQSVTNINIVFRYSGVIY